MATKKTAAATEATEETTATTTETTTARVFTLARLKKDCLSLFGVTSSTFAGATCDLAADGEYTIEEVKTHIEEWKKKGVK